MVLAMVLTGAGGALATAPGPAEAAVDNGAPLYADRVVVRTYRTLFDKVVTSASRPQWYWRLIGRPDPSWLARELMKSSDYRAGPGTLDDEAFISRMYLHATGAPATRPDTTFWLTAFHAGAADRAALVAHLVEHGFTFPLRRPSSGIPCTRFDRGGPAPRCERGSAGTIRDVAILQVPFTNLRANKAWYNALAGLVEAGQKAGFSLRGERDPNVPAWMASPGSWRSYDEQLWLYRNGYPANPPGRSMHEWGMAVDLSCNGRPITKDARCWAWVRANGPRFGVMAFAGADRITASEAWHFSSNGR